MPRTEAMKRAIKKYEQEKVDEILARFPKGEKALIQAHVTKQGETIHGFINRAARETIARDEKGEQ